jgi:hypothetical protein
MVEKGKSTSWSFALLLASLLLMRIRRPKPRHFNGLRGSKLSRSVILNWDELDYTMADLLDLESDICQAVWQLSQLRGNTFNLLNTMNIVLLPKKDMAETVGDFRPISLVHNIAKIFSKILALRHAPRLPDLVSSNQSAFVKKRCIHDNFVLVQSIVKDLHRRKTPTLFVKLDIAKAFDSI